MEDYGRLEQGNVMQRAVNADSETAVAKEDPGKQADEVKDTLMQLEERSTGAVPWSAYKSYFFYAGGIVWIPIIIIMLLLNQGMSGECYFQQPHFIGGALTVPRSRYQLVAVVLDLQRRPWLPARSLYGGLRWVR